MALQPGIEGYPERVLGKWKAGVGAVVDEWEMGKERESWNGMGNL